MNDPHLTPNWTSSALLTIDVQRDFLSEAPHGVPGTTEVLPALSRLAAAFRAARRPIVHVVRLYQPGGRDADLVRRTLLAGGAAVVAPGSDGSAIAAELLPPGAPSPDPGLLLSGEPQHLVHDLGRTEMAGIGVNLLPVSAITGALRTEP